MSELNANDSTTNLNTEYDPRTNNTYEMNNYVVLIKLSDLPCFSSK